MWWLLFTVLFARSEQEQQLPANTESSHNAGGIYQVEVRTSIGSIKYEDGEILIAQNQQKLTDFFFTPFPRVQPEETECHDSISSGRIELALQVELYTSQLVQAVYNYLHKHQSALCGNTTSTSLCSVALLPMNSIRLVQKDTPSDDAKQKYRLNENWQSATMRLRSMEFAIYSSNMSVCEQFRRSIMERCRMQNYEVHYSLYGQKTVQKSLEVNTEHIRHTALYNQIRAEFPTVESVVLTGGDFKNLITEASDRTTMTLRMEEGFENLAEPTLSIEKLLERQLSARQVQLDQINDKQWESLYWTSELTRPDRLAKVLNTIFRKEDGANNRFIYDQQAAKAAMKTDLTQHDIVHLGANEYDISKNVGAYFNIDRADLTEHTIDQGNSVAQNSDEAHLTHHDKLRLEQMGKLFDSHDQSSSSSRNSQSGGGGKTSLNVFGLFKFGGSGGGSSDSQSSNTDNQKNVRDHAHGKTVDTDLLDIETLSKSVKKQEEDQATWNNRTEENIKNLSNKDLSPGNGVNTFHLPDFRNRFPYGSVTPDVQGIRGGNQYHTLTVRELPPHQHAMGEITVNYSGDHSHTLYDPGHIHQINYFTWGLAAGTDRLWQVMDYMWFQHKHKHFNTSTAKTGISMQSAGQHTHTITAQPTNGTGQGKQFEILPPYITAAFIIYTG
ncbi:unnamed protein product [Didymodactylos carnosus]|uniref:Uncharacterized protein n=1 Tax=Didymodactylos carnosus TaxID=1234261 RepID=A0A8S2K7U8_9BILA|nr:unnamed protein product [Didymodactylos carnosus]CAF3829444.1 unnamed protein product [Didymodactylos carnosus]